jgi:hypothetical protein
VDRLVWVWLSRVWSGWRSTLAIVKPETVLAWHRAGFRFFWTWKVQRGRPGRPVASHEVRDLIRRMCRENPSWGAPRIHGELLKLGIDIGETSVSKYMVRCRKPPSQTWRTFLENHLQQLVSIDFFTVPTIRFQVLYVFLVLAHDRRRIVHCNVTAHPTAEWTGQQLREAFPFDQCRATCCGTAMLSSAMPSGDRCETWASRKCCAPLAIPLAAGLRRAHDWFDPARVPGPCARVPRNVPPTYPSFVFGLLSPIENASLLREGLARAEIDPAGAHGESGGTATGRRSASPLRTTDRLRPSPP